MNEVVSKVMDELGELRSARSRFDGYWDDISTYVVPHRGMRLNGRDVGTELYSCEEVYDTTASRAANTLAQGMLAQITPMESPWFKLKPPARLEGNEEAEAYYSEATEKLREALVNSNFYPSVQEFYIDRGAFGIGAMRFTEGDEEAFVFKCEPLGSYFVSVGESGDLDQFFREFELTGRQALAFFGEELSEKTRERAGKKEAERLSFVHKVAPRKVRDRSQPLNPEHFAYESVYVCVSTKELVGKVGGLHEHPYLISRYRTFGGNCAYGWTPSIEAMPDIVQLNFLEKMQDFKAEQEVMPPMIAPFAMEGQLDLTGGAVNYFGTNVQRGDIGRLFEHGRFDIGEHRTEHKRDQIRKSFHVDMLEAISSLDDGVQRTAAEIAARQQEKIIPFSPTFSLLISEFCNPLLKRGFKILYRRGVIPPPPESILDEDEKGVFLHEPEVQYTGRIALAIEQAENSALMQSFEAGSMMAEAGLSVMGAIRWDEAFRGMTRNFGVPERYITTEEELEAQRMMQMEQQEQMMQLEQAQQVSEIGKNAAQAMPALESL